MRNENTCFYTKLTKKNSVTKMSHTLSEKIASLNKNKLCTY